MLALVACKQADSPKPQPPAEGSAAPAPVAEGTAAPACEPLPFAASTPVAEASGTAWLVVDGKLSLLVVGDSGHAGDYTIVDAETGETREQGKLPLGKHGDDIEGLATLGERIFGLTSDGWMRVWKREGKGFALVDGPYAVGTSTKLNFEGLALAPEARGGCAGFACSKGDGHLYCLVERDGRFAIEPSRRLAVARRDAIGDCAFAQDGTLWLSTNIFHLGRAFRIAGWEDLATAKVVPVDIPTLGNPEVIAARGDLVYRMSDLGGSPSLMAKFRCRAIGR